MNQRKSKSDQNNYNIISLKVASFLKEQGTPVKAKKIHWFLTEEKCHSISYANLQSNYLSRMNQDHKMIVEWIYRGSLQYRNQPWEKNANTSVSTMNLFINAKF